jgi:hypothetical protein
MAGALSRRDIEMIFRADTDKATRPIGDLAKEVKNLRGVLEEQIKTAEKGDASLDSLAATTRDLKKAQEELGTARGMLTALNGQVAALDKAEAKLAEATSKYAELKAQVDGAEKPTKRLTNSFEAAGRAVAVSTEAVARINAEVTDTRARVEAAIGPVENFQQSFASIADTSKEIARGLAVAGEAAQEFQTKINAGKAESGLFEQLAGRSKLLQEQIQYISQFEDRVERLRTAEAALASQEREEASVAMLNAVKRKAAVDDVLQGNAALEASFAALAADEQRTASVNAFRQIAANANAAAIDVTRFGASSDATATSAVRLADSIMAIVNPAASASNSIDGLEANITAAASVLEGTKKTAQIYNVAMNELAAANAAAVRQAGQIDGYRAQQAALDGSTGAFRAAQAEVVRLASELATTEAPTDEMAKALKRAEAALETAGSAMKSDEAKLNTLGAALKEAGHDTDNLALSDQRLTKATLESTKAQNEIANKVKGTTGALGLSLQSAQNLGYQVNDIVTQLSLGQGLFRTLASQGGQLVQDAGIRGLVVQYAKFLPIIGGVALALGALYTVMKRAASGAEELQNATGYLASLGEAGSLSADGIAKASIQMQDLGVKAEDARSVLHAFNEDGLDPQYLTAFIDAAHAASDVTGKDFKEAFGLLTEAMNGGWAEVQKLNEAFPVLSDAEQVQIKAMYDSGQESEARELVFARFYGKMDDAAASMRGPWKTALTGLDEAWHGFLDYLGKTQFVTNMKGQLDELSNAAVYAAYLLNRVRGLSEDDAGRAALGIRKPGSTPKGDPAAAQNKENSAQGKIAVADAERELKAKKLLTKEERLRNAEIAAREKFGKNFTDKDRDDLAALARTKELNAINEEERKKAEAAGKKAASARKSAESAADALANKIASAEESLQSGLDGIDAKVAKTATGTLTQQLQGAADAVTKEYDKLLRKADDYSKLTNGKGTIGGKSIKDYKDTITADEQQLTTQAQLGVYEQNVNKLIESRKQLLADIEEQQNRGDITSAQALAKATEVTSRLNAQIASAAHDAADFATNISDAKPSAALQAFIDKMGTAGNSADGVAALKSFGQKQLGEEESKLNTIIAERNSLIAANNELVKLGAMSQSDADKAAEAAYGTSKTKIDAQIAAMRELLNMLNEVRGANGEPLISDEAYAAFQAKLQGVGVQTQYVNANVVQLRDGIQNILTQNAGAAIDRMAQAFGNFAAGTESAGSAAMDAVRALGDFVAQTLIMVGKLILQAFLVKAIESATGFPLTAMLNAAYGGNSGGGNAGATGGSGGILGSIAKIFHSGGTVGDSSSGVRSRKIGVTPSMLSSIPRYHQGTAGAGLDSTEQLAVVQKGEKILTEEQQRQEAKRAVPATGGTGLRQVLAFGDSEVAAAMQGPEGERVTVTHLRRNVPMLKQLLRE